MRFLLAICLLTWTGALSAETVGPAKGTLVIVGGGKVGPQIVDRFVALAGGPEANFVVFPTAGEDAQINLEKTKTAFSQRFGVKNVTVLHTRDPHVADSEDFIAPIRSASAVWFEGGRQWRLADSYLGTKTEREVKALLDRGGVVGGSSAGATIQGSYLVRGSTKDNATMMAPGHERGFGLIRNAAIDQHLITRKRENDLVGVIEAHPDLLGIGIDESTAVAVHGDGLEVLGESKVAIYDNHDHDGKKYYFLSRGDTFDLRRK